MAGAFRTKYKRKAPTVGRRASPPRTYRPPDTIDTAFIRTANGLAVGEQVHEYERLPEPPTKRVRIHFSPQQEDINDTTPQNSVMEGEWVDEEPPANVRAEESRKTRKERIKVSRKAISEKMNEWRQDFDNIGAIMLSWEAPPLPITQCSCGSNKNARYRCLECNESGMKCGACMVTAHRNLWFHYVEAWEGSFFRRYDLVSLNFTIHLGHEGARCPHLAPDQKPSNFVIGHTNGMHDCKIMFCDCPGSDTRVNQLLRSQMWPATRDSPQSAFTIVLLKHWQQMWFHAKISTLHFLRALARYTNNTFPAEVKGRTPEFRVVSRLFAHLTMVKRSGKLHGLEVPNRDPNDITVPCVACPSPGFNLPENWKEAPKHLRYIYRIVLGADGNHSLQKRSKGDDSEDASLGCGQGFFVDPSSMQKMVSESYARDADAPSYTCSGFKVARSQRDGKWRFVEISGIIAITCRHVLFRSGAVVDMITGERYDFTDAALAGALRGTLLLLEWGFSYDVVCIYIKGMLERFHKNYPHLAHIVEQIQCCVPSFHVNAHRDLCQIVYGLPYAQGFGHICGEWVETPWSENNIAGLVTREMTGGGRHDALNDLFNFWNRVKLERLVDSLVKQLEKAYEAQLQTTEQFANLVALAGAFTSTQWAAMAEDSTAPTPANHEAKERAYSSSVYILDRSEMPTRDKALSELILTHEGGDKPALESMVSHLRKGAAHFVKAGIELDLEYFTLRERLGQDTTPDKTLRDSMRSFRTRFDAWRVEQHKHMPLLPLPEEDTGVVQSTSTDDDDSWDDLEEILALPSDFNSSELDTYALRSLATCELKLRIGLAFDLLGDVREAVKHSAAHLEEKKREAHGKKDHTREQAKITKSRNLSRREARRYNHNYGRIVTLRTIVQQPAPEGKMETNLQQIDLDKDLKMVNLTAGRSRGDTGLLANASWIWSVFLPTKDKRVQPDRKGKGKEVTTPEEDAASWVTQVDCAHWHRARMAKAQADAFVNYTCADFRHARSGFDRMSTCWTTAADRPDVEPGAQAYARQQAAMYARMRDDCEAAYAKALKPNVDGDALDHTLSLRGYLENSVVNLAPYEDLMKILPMA